MKKENRSRFYACCSIIFILLILTVIFFSETDKVSFSFVQQITESTVRSEVSQFDLNIEAQIHILKAIGESLPENLDTNDIIEVSNQLIRYGNLYNLESLYLINKDGTGITYNNQTTHLHLSNAYSLFTSGKEISTGIEIPLHMTETHFYLAVPIRRNNEVQFILKAYYSNQSIKKMLLFPFFEDLRSGLVSQSGMAVTDSAATFSDPSFLRNIILMEPGFFRSELADEEFLVYHSPTSSSGVFFFIEIPVSSINRMTSTLKEKSFIFANCVIILCIILICFLMKSERHQKNEILKLTEKLRQSEARYQNAFNYKDNIAWEYNPVTKELSAVIKRKDGYSQEIRITDTIETVIQQKIIHPDYVDEFNRFAGQIFSDPPYSTCILKLRRYNQNEYYWARLSFIISTDGKNDTQTILGLIEDISDIKEVQDKYDQEKQTIAAMTDNSVCYYLINLTTGAVLEKKSRDIPAHELEKLNDMASVISREIEYIHDKEDIARLKKVCTINNIHTLLETGKAFEDIEYKRRSPENGEIQWISLSVKPVKTGKNDLVAAIQLVNIDNRKKQELLLQRRAERDLLTDLYNKITMSSLINEYLKKPRKEDQTDALIMIDADNYKSVNDTFGHVFGDKVLIDIADSLKSSVKQSDLVGRVGGDEFMVFLKDMRSKDDMISIIKRISDGIRHTYAENDSEVTVSASIGIAYVTPEINSFLALYKLADNALYDAKEAGKNCFRFANIND